MSAPIQLTKGGTEMIPDVLDAWADVTDARNVVREFARRCLVRPTCRRLVGTSFGCLALANSETLWGRPSVSGKGWTPVTAMIRTFMAARSLATDTTDL